MTTQILQTFQTKRAKVIHNVSCEQLEEIDSFLEDVPGLKLIDLDGTLDDEVIPQSVRCGTEFLRGDSSVVIDEAGGQRYDKMPVLPKSFSKSAAFSPICA